ncbi:hypothetical protein [Pseudomonas knackmussii]|uniref:hypothetical protein n=1 Tax=Pseudomonas knackmussii TaxID=65741 RepID=UPI0013625CDC|nr:hypothetical protein [Pseudomonas knackmussii]
MKRILYLASLATALAVPWAVLLGVPHGRGSNDLCAMDAEALIGDSTQGTTRALGALTYSFESSDTALMQFEGEIVQQTAQHTLRYHVNRTAEVHYEVRNDHIKSTTLSAARTFWDNAPDALVYRYAHPLLQPGAQYQARLYRLSDTTLASGSETTLRYVCTLQKHRADMKGDAAGQQAVE